MTMNSALCAFAFWLGATAQTVAAPLVPLLVQPSGPEVPANLLRISLVFARPVGEQVLPRLMLRRVDGSPIEQPFLEQELWSPSGTVLTVLLHPGRVKRGLIAHDTEGPVLRADEGVVLTLDGRDIKRWKVGSDDRDGPVPTAWKLGGVRAGSRQPLVVDLDGPIDGRDVDYLAVADQAGERVPGIARLQDGERRWSFVPASPWKRGHFQLAVFSQLEDPCGNRVGGHFEETKGVRDANQDVALPLRIR